MPPIRACDVCFKRKIECCRPGPNVPCNWCNHQKLECTVSREKKTVSAKRIKAKDVERLREQIKQLESALAQAHASKSQAITETPSASKYFKSCFTDEDGPRGISESSERLNGSATRDLLPAGQASQTSGNGIHAHIVFATRLFEKNWYHRGMPILSKNGLEWIASRTGHSTTALRSYLSLGHYSQPCWKSLNLQGHVSTAELWDLPDKSLAHELFNNLSSSSFQILFPSLDKVLFEETINTVFEPFEGMHTSHSHISARACFWAACAIISYLKISSQTPSPFGCNLCAARAERFLELSNGPANLDILQALILLYKYRTATGHYSSAAALHSAACRMVYELNGHFDHPMRRNEIQISLFKRRKDHIRKLFWLCYLADKDLALLSGLPPILANEYCDVGVPEEYFSQNTFLHWFDEGADINDIETISWDRAIPFLLGDPHLGVLKEKIFRLLYSPSALKIIDSELLTRIRHLDDELEGWRLSLPYAIRPKLSISQGQGVSPTGTFSSYLISVQLQLEYHYLLTVIHTPVRRFGAAQDPETSPPEELHSVMHSSIDLSLEASRSTLRLLNEPIAMLKRETFWYSIIYPLVAAMSLYVNILIHPVGPRAVADAKSLALALKIMEKMRLPAISDHQSNEAEQAHQLITELLKLARAAILKADVITAVTKPPVK
ncbi:hypothetical protein LI328DRAFT_167725 [Trichoderma asperelloides]|nr:hypothetical protein LI328DRAFT_167725 [Trichoderma asperelloides]